MNQSLYGLVLAALLIARPVWADDDDDKKPGKGKGKPEAKPATVQIDLSKLPPDLAKQLMKYLGSSAKPEKGPPPKTTTPQAKGPPQGKGKAAAIQLPPGLAKKPADHPGRLNYIKAHSGQVSPGKAPATPAKKKPKNDDDD